MGLQTKAQPLANGTPLNPQVGARAFQQVFDFSQSPSIPFTLATDMSRGIDNVQSVFIDNSNGNAALFMLVALTGELIVCPPYSQGFFPILFPISSNFQCTVRSASPVQVTVQFMNFENDLNIWNVTTPLSAGTQTVQGSVSVMPSPGAWINRSAVLATAATSQLLMAANGTRKRLLLRNPATANGQNIGGNLEPAYFNFTSAAGVEDGISLELLPGETYDTGIGPVTTEAVYYNAATVGHRLIAREM